MPPLVISLGSIYISGTDFLLVSQLASFSPASNAKADLSVHFSPRGSSQLSNTLHHLQIKHRNRIFHRRVESETDDTADDITSTSTTASSAPPTSASQSAAEYSPLPPLMSSSTTMPSSWTSDAVYPTADITARLQQSVVESKIEFTITAVLFCITTITAVGLLLNALLRNTCGKTRRSPKWACFRGTKERDGAPEWKMDVTRGIGSPVDLEKGWKIHLYGSPDTITGSKMTQPSKAREAGPWFRGSLPLGQFWDLLRSPWRKDKPSISKTGLGLQATTTLPVPPLSNRVSMTRSASEPVSRKAKITLETIVEEDDEQDTSTVHSLPYLAERQTVLSLSSIGPTSEDSRSESKIGQNGGLAIAEKRQSHASGRSRKGSDASHISVVELEAFEDSTGSGASSMTSVASAMESQEDSSVTDEEEELDAEETIVQVVQVNDVLTKNVETKRGILLSMRLPSFIISAPYSTEGRDVTDTVEEEKWARTSPETLLPTDLSTSSLATQESGMTLASIDLDDFPLPPSQSMII